MYKNISKFSKKTTRLKVAFAFYFVCVQKGSYIIRSSIITVVANLDIIACVFDNSFYNIEKLIIGDFIYHNLRYLPNKTKTWITRKSIKQVNF